MAKALKIDKRDYITALNEFSEEMFDNDGVTLEVFITERLSQGATLHKICNEIEFPAVHLTTWLTKEHPDLMNSAARLYANKESGRIMKETYSYDEDTYKADSAKHMVQLRILEKQNLEVHKSEEDQKAGMNFNINVVMPDYVTQNPVIEINETKEIDME